MGTEVDFNSIHFEKKLSGLKDSQDSINSACLWCLEHKQHHKKIVATWLSVLKRVKVDQRLTLFYLANDVIQYSKRKNFDFVESWGTALQKATTLVRDAKVKHKILRIFKIWEQRGVYSEDFITDLSGLISVSPAAKKIDESHEFQSAQLVNKIRICSKLESETDRKLQLFKQHNPKMQDGEALMSSLKDRAHVDDVEKEMNEYVNHMEKYIETLKMEIKARNSLINLLTTADTQLEKDRKDVKVVAVAYKSFATRVKNLKKKLEDKQATLSSPIPSPDINAPSPSPDSDLELPDNDSTFSAPATNTSQSESIYDTNMGFYTPSGFDRGNSGNVDPTNFSAGFSSFIGSGMIFNLNSNDSKVLSSMLPNIADPPPPPAPVPAPNASTGNDAYNSSYNNQMPLAPPPLPPFTNEGYSDYGNNYGNNSYNEQMSDPYQTYDNSAYSQSSEGNNDYSNIGRGGQNFDQYKCDEYNPEEDVETWENNDWDCAIPAETPASPPEIEQEAFLPPIEYHEEPAIPGAVDVDHLIMNNNTDKKEIDHRNLISLTGSPKETEEKKEWHPERHSFPRRPSNKDFRGRPQPPRSHTSDNNESIDMDLSDDDVVSIPSEEAGNCKKGLLPPPPFPIDLDTYEHEQDALEEQSWRRQSEERWKPPPPPPSPKMMRGGPPRRNARVMGHANGVRGEFNNWGDFRDANHGQRGDHSPRGWYRGTMPPSKFSPRSGWGPVGPPGPPCGPSMRMPMRGRPPRPFNNGYRKY